MVAHEPDHGVSSVRRKAEPLTHRVCKVGTSFGMITRQTLGEVVQQRGERQQLRVALRGHFAVKPVVVQQRCAFGDRFEQMPIHGEAVVRVALRKRLHALPFWKQALEHTHVIEGFQCRERLASALQQLEKRLRLLRGPRGRGHFREACKRQTLNPALVARRKQRDPQHEKRSYGGVAIDDEMIVSKRDSVTKIAVCDREARSRALFCTQEAAPGFVCDPTDHAPGRGHVMHQRVRIRLVEDHRDRVLVLQRKEIRATAPGAVQRDPHVEQQRVRVRESVHIVCLDEPARHQRLETPRRTAEPAGPSKRMYIAKSARALLEIRLEHLRDAAVTLLSFTRPVGQLCEEATSPR